MNFEFTSEHKMMVESLRKFLKTECTPEVIRKHDSADLFPEKIYKELTKLGVTGLTVPEEYGGMGRDILGAVLVLEEISRVWPALGWVYVACAFYGGENISKSGSAAQKTSLLPGLASGETLFAYAVTEPNAGSDATAAKVKAERINGDNYSISGSKTFITNADHANYLLTFVRTDTTVDKYSGLSLFVIPALAKGVSFNKIEKLGYKGSTLCEIYFDDVQVSSEDILGGPENLNKGWTQLLATLDVEHIELAACSLGLAQGAFDLGLNYAEEREQFGRPIIKFQAISHMLADLDAEIHAARLVLYHSAWLAQNNSPCAKEAAIAKLLTTELAKRSALDALQVHGGYGYTMEYDIQRYVRDCLVLPIGGGTSQIQRNLIAGSLRK